MPAGRRINLPPETGNSVNATEQKIFNTHRTADASEKAIVEYMKRQNDKLHFVAQTVKQIGYPRWDKAIAVSKTDASVNGRGQTGDSANIYYVPFVRDSQNYVNASLIVKTNPADTSFSYLCDWQYSILNFSTNTITDTTAEKFALFFMVLDKNTFGHQNFNIQDKRLFNGNTNYSDTANIERKIAIEPAQASGRASLLASICYNTTVITVHENWHCTQSGQCVSGVCDECALCVDYSFSYHTEVHCFDEEVGGPPSGGGGTGGGGGGTPPECGEPLQPLAGRINVMDPCGPGWVPDYGDGNTVSSEPDPCAKVAPLKTDTLFKNNINVLKTKLSGDREYAYLHKPDGSWPTSLIPGIPNECEVKVSLYTGMTNLRNYTHIHNNSCELPIFGTEDLKTIGEFLNVHKYLSPQHNLMDSLMSFGLLTDSAYYVLVIDNPNSLENFYFEYFSEDGSKDIKELSDNYNSYNIKRTNSSATNEQQFLQFLKREGIGMKLLKANSNLSAFSILSLNRNNNLVTTPCPQ